MTRSEEQHESLAVRTAFLADYAKVEPTGLFSVIGGGITRFRAQGLPASFTFAVVLQVSTAADELINTPFNLAVIRPAGDPAITISGEVGITPSPDALSNMAFNISTIIDVEGPWRVRLGLGEDRPGVDLVFTVELTPSSG
ncbi:MAG: hypothetical protein WCF33_24680 [Pseudonocardiaceae bacterium]